tara:strand:+ start:322 stop:1197 length:876 start_codon:yes stop_codon:yes gene_type:complete
MKNIKVLIPVYNDWDSLFKLLNDINNVISSIKNCNFSCLIINDCSTIETPKIEVPSNISSLSIINMKKNKGHARCNALGIKYLAKNENFDYLIIMDGDGEDRPEEIKILIEKAFSEPSKSVVAKRVKRSEGFFFQLLYQMHKFLTFFFTGKNINFGNYSCLKRDDVKILSGKTSLWSSFSGSLKKHILELNSVDSIRGTRFYGPSKMSLINLIIHSFSIIAVFRATVFLRSAILLIVLFYMSLKIHLISLIFQISLVTFNLAIYLVSLRENKQEFLDSELDIVNINTYTHQ